MSVILIHKLLGFHPTIQLFDSARCEAPCFFCWFRFPKRLPGVYNSAAWATVSTICRLGGKVCGCWLVATHGNSWCQCWGVECKNASQLRYYVESWYPSLSSFSFQDGRILEHVENHKTSLFNCHFISRSTFYNALMLSAICWSFVQLGIWIKQRVASLPMCWQPAHKPSRWWSRLEGPKRDMEKIKFRLWIHRKKMWSCSFFKTPIYTRWEIDMILYLTFDFVSFCFGILEIHISFTISLWFQHTTLPPKMFKHVPFDMTPFGIRSLGGTPSNFGRNFWPNPRHFLAQNFAFLVQTAVWVIFSPNILGT